MKIEASPLIQVSELLEIKTSDNLVIVNATSGHEAFQKYSKKHLDGAFFLDLNEHLSEIGEDAAKGGRHPLPKVEEFIKTSCKIGISPEKHVVVYDDKGGANSAARLWWMLKAIGHEKVQVLNGGIQEAEKQGYPINAEKAHPKLAELYKVDTWRLPMAKLDEVEKASQDADHIVIDVRATLRYNGEFEPLDLIAGHIPNAINIPFEENLDANGLFNSPAELRKKYDGVIDAIPKENMIIHCGSGVTACHTILALAHAGYELPKLYVGSWSEWSRNNKPMATK